ncbi:MAG: class I SAM-dependent methyltransferase [Streptosporangiaceae bacterium]
MHETLRRLHRGQRAHGTTIDRFRLNELVSQVAFADRRGRVYRRIVALAGVRSGEAVLDVGCSGGYLARKLAAAAGPGGRVTGVDPSQAAIGDTRRYVGPAMTFTAGTAQDLALPDASFDVVTCTLAMHDVPARRRRDALGEMYRVTRPGGRMLIADFDSAPAALPAARRRGADAPRRRAAASVGSLDELAAGVGYRTYWQRALAGYADAVEALVEEA